eukprot:snap_masked-scaffold_29-processed-gene-2.54-mRNA-1 protein AED:1.00 eAED:1.00 QI:0/-1/0/0/-1/1/1/0/62
MSQTQSLLARSWPKGLHYSNNNLKNYPKYDYGGTNGKEARIRVKAMIMQLIKQFRSNDMRRK